MSVKAAQQTESAAMLECLMTAADDAARRELVGQCPSLDWEQIVSTLTDRVRQEIHISTTQAQRTADIAMVVAEALDNKAALAKSQRAKANALYAMDEHAAAIEMHQSAATLFEAAGERLELARTLSGSIQPLLLLGRHDDALAAGERARAIYTEQGNTWRLARLEINVGNIYQRQDRFPEALECYDRAYRELLTHDDAEGLAAVLSNLSLCYISLNEFSKALEFHRKARQHCEEKGMPILVAYADYNIAYLYFLRGEYGRAIQMLREAAVSAKKAGDAYQLALCDLDLSEIYLEVNLGEEAATLASRAHDAFQKLGFGHEAAKAFAFAAIAASRQGRPLEGLKLFAKAKELFLRDKNQVWPSLIDLYQALVFFNEGRFFEARRLCMAALEFFSTSTMRRKAVLAELLLARISLRLNDVSSARQHCLAALQQLGELESPILLYQAEFLMGEIGRAIGDDEQAYESYSRARCALETLRGSLRGEELKIAFFDNKLETYEHLVDLCLRRPEQLQPEETSQARIQRLEERAHERETALLHALQEATVAEAGQVGLRAPTNVSVDEIRSTLPANTILLEYFCVQDRILICILSHEDLQILPVTLQSRVQKLLQLLQFQLSKFRLDPQYVSTFQDSLLESTLAHLKSLYRELLAPVRASLNADHLVFVPHGLLHYVPMHALHDGESYLTDRFSISYAPSATIYSLCQRSYANTAGASLIMGIADVQAPSILDEVAALQAILPSAKLFVGEDATEEVLRQQGSGSRIIHIATHGYFRQDNPMFSAIRLGGSYLNLYDLYHLKLPAELVVLSGCATGLNVIKPGDEQIGLVRGLLQAGAQSLVLSLWDVHDHSTKEFMVAFYTRLQQGLSKALALQGAALELRERYPHPYYWAPFLLIGKG